MSTCRDFLKAVREMAHHRTRSAMTGAAVLGDTSGYTVELRDGSQVYVGRACCKYCARVEAFGKVDSRLALGQSLCDYAPT